MQSPGQLKVNIPQLMSVGKIKIRPWQRILFRFAGIGEDEWGQFISLEDMPDEDFLDWCKTLLNIKDKESDFYKLIVKDVIQEARRRTLKAS